MYVCKRQSKMRPDVRRHATVLSGEANGPDMGLESEGPRICGASRAYRPYPLAEVVASS